MSVVGRDLWVDQGYISLRSKRDDDIVSGIIQLSGYLNVCHSTAEVQIFGSMRELSL